MKSNLCNKYKGNTQLPGKFDIIKIDLSPTEQYKSVHQEIMFQEYVSSKAKDKLSQLEQYYENVLEKTRSELSFRQQYDAVRQELDSYRKRNAELSEKLMERSRQYQRLQALYEAQKRKFISPSFFDRQTANEKQTGQGDMPFGISAANDIFSGIKDFGNRTEKPNVTEAERDFILRPAHPPPMRTPMRSQLLDLEIQEVHHPSTKRNQKKAL